MTTMRFSGSILPRNFSNIILGVVYHPPCANDNTMKEYLLSSLESLESKFPNCAIILAGNFNRTLLPFLERAFRPFLLKPVITFPTSGDRTLDQIFANISSLYTYPSRLPPFRLSDHHSVLIEANVRDKNLKLQYKTIKARDKRPSKRANLERFLLQVHALVWIVICRADLWRKAPNSDRCNKLGAKYHYAWTFD